MVFLNIIKNLHFSIETAFRGKHSGKNLWRIHVKADLDYKGGRNNSLEEFCSKPCLQICLFLDVYKFIIRLTLFVLFCCIFWLVL
jgi:hypothetical protein